MYILPASPHPHSAALGVPVPTHPSPYGQRNLGSPPGQAPDTQAPRQVPKALRQPVLQSVPGTQQSSGPSFLHPQVTPEMCQYTVLYSVQGRSFVAGPVQYKTTMEEAGRSQPFLKYVCRTLVAETKAQISWFKEALRTLLPITAQDYRRCSSTASRQREIGRGSDVELSQGPLRHQKRKTRDRLIQYPGQKPCDCVDFSSLKQAQ